MTNEHTNDRKSHPINDPAIDHQLEYWFDYGSNYSYLSTMRIEQAAAQVGAKIAWRPFLLGPIFRSFGWDDSPFVLQPVKGAYVWRDMERQCAKYGIAWRRPSRFPRPAVLPSRVALVGAHKDWIGEFSRRIAALNFAHDQDIDSIDVVTQVLVDLGLPAESILVDALAESNKLRLRQLTEAAARRGVFGAPTFFVGDEMFWGNDRLDDALALLARR